MMVWLAGANPFSKGERTRFRAPVLAAQVDPAGIFCSVAVLNPGLRLIHHPAARVDADIRLDAGQFAIP